MSSLNPDLGSKYQSQTKDTKLLGEIADSRAGKETNMSLQNPVS